MNTIAMEMLPLHGCGQSYGFVLYRAYISSQTKKITILQLRDYGVVMTLYLPKLYCMFHMHDYPFLLPLAFPISSLSPSHAPPPFPFISPPLSPTLPSSLLSYSLCRL